MIRPRPHCAVPEASSRQPGIFRVTPRYEDDLHKSIPEIRSPASAPGVLLRTRTGHTNTFVDILSCWETTQHLTLLEVSEGSKG